MQTAILVIIIAAAVFAVFYFSPRSIGGRIIESPRFGILNLKGEEAAALISNDASAIASVLGQPQQSTTAVPQCDVLFVYCDMEPEGGVRNCRDGLREIIRDSGASVVVVASENDGEAYVASGKRDTNKKYGRANLVMTLQRNGEVFPSFFARLFADMKQGVPMPVAWVKLAPQVPGHDQADCPGTIFSCEAGQVAFR